MCIDRNGRLFGWGQGSEGCLGFGDGKKRLSVCPITFFDNKRVIDVTCGDKFTVVVAETFSDKKQNTSFDIFNSNGDIDLNAGLRARMLKMK